MSNARSIIKGSLRSIGKIGRGRDMTAEQAADGLELLNQLLASWKGEGLIEPFRTTEELTYSASQQSYTIGSGGDLDTVRPIQIIAAFHRDGAGSDHSVDFMTLQEYNSIHTKDISTYPCRMYYEPEYPLGRIYFDYKPGTDLTLHLTSLKEITAFADLDTTITLPAEYDRFMRTHLAIETAPDYGHKVSQELVNAAVESKANIKRLNSGNRYDTLVMDSGLSRGCSGNINSGYN